MSKLRTEACIARANEIIEKAWSFAGWCIIREDAITAQIDRIQGSLPQDINDASNILRRKEDIIEHARYEAERIKSDALNEKSRILSESELLRAVQEEAAVVREKLIAECEEIKNKAYSDAENIKMQASEEARRMREGAEEYVEGVLANLEANLAQQQTIVQNGQRYMEQRKMEIQRNYGYDQPADGEYQKEIRQEEYQKY